MAEKIFDIEKMIPLSSFSAAFTPYVRKHLDEDQIKMFLSVFVKQRKMMYKDKEPLQWIQLISVIDGVVNELNIHRFLNFYYPRMLAAHPILGNDIKNRVAKYLKVSQGLALAREEFIKAMNHIYATTGNQVP
jgi:hypothetical protein